MKFIANHLNLIGLLLLSAFAATAAGIYWDVPAKARPQTVAVQPTAKPRDNCCAGDAAEMTAANCPHMAAATNAVGGATCPHTP